MSQYYQVQGLKIRVSDHEPNFGVPNRTPDVELYVRNIEGKLMSVRSQLEHYCDHNNCELTDFQEVLRDWEDCTYNVDVFKSKIQEDINDERDYSELSEDEKKEVNKRDIGRKNAFHAKHKENEDRLTGHHLDRFAKHPEIKALSEKTGLSQSYIKKHFNIR